MGGRDSWYGFFEKLVNRDFRLIKEIGWDFVVFECI